MPMPQTKFFRQLGDVINVMNDASRKKTVLRTLYGKVGKKGLVLGGTAGLGLWLYSRSIGSKKFDQGES